MNFSRVAAPIALGATVLFSACISTSSQVNFPSVPSGFSQPPMLTTSLYKPDGQGPFPAMVLLHTCGGLTRHLFDWAGRLIADGYVVLVVDSHGARGVQWDCAVPPIVHISDIAADAFAALAHLQSLSFVDADRIGVMGFSKGGMAALRTASAGYVKRSSSGIGFRAVVAFYPRCTGSSPGQTHLYDDISTPLLILLAELDDVTPPAGCVEKAERLRSHGQPVSWKVYPGTTHSFDGSSGTRIGVRGVPFTSQYNPEATANAWNDSRAFLAEHVKRR